MHMVEAPFGTCVSMCMHVHQMYVFTAHRHFRGSYRVHDLYMCALPVCAWWHYDYFIYWNVLWNLYNSLAKLHDGYN